MLVDRQLIGSYCIESELGRGGMGTVFRARHVDSGRVVALKVLSDPLASDPDFGERFRREGRIQASLQHPNVATVYEAGGSDGALYLAMRLIDGPPLVDLIRNHELGVRRAVELLAQVADALDAAHAAGLVHRDVKPHNVLVGSDDQAYLADFGLTRAGSATRMTVGSAIVGTVAYLAPEVARGEVATPASDRYALAAMAFECLTGSVVFPRSTDAGVLFAHAHDVPPRIGARRTAIADGLDDLFERALAKDPAERPAGAGELIAAVGHELARSGAIELPPPGPTGVEALGRDAPTDQVPVPRPRGSAPPASRNRSVILAAAVGGAAIAAAVVAGVWALSGDTNDGPASAPASGDRAGLRNVGADLGGPAGRPLDCRDRPPQPASPPCTIVQSDLPGATLVVPENGTIRRWSVRGARGELTLVVMRPRDGGAFQVTTSGIETVGSADVHGFDTDLDVERGDRVGVLVAPGSAVGVRDGVTGTSTERWIPPLAGVGRPADRGAGTGFDHELLLRVGVLPGAKRRAAPQVTGSAAARLPAGRPVERRRIRFGGRRIDLVLVDAGGRFALDQLVDGRRVARIDVPELRPQAQITLFLAAVWSPEGGGLDLSFVNKGSARVVQLVYEVNGRQFNRLR